MRAVYADADVMRLVRNDTGPQIKLTLVDDVSEDAVDLTGAGVTVYVRPISSTGAVSVTREAEVLDSVDAADGKATVIWETGDLDLKAGDYGMEVKVTFPDATVQTVWELLRLRIREPFE